MLDVYPCVTFSASCMLGVTLNLYLETRPMCWYMCTIKLSITLTHLCTWCDILGIKEKKFWCSNMCVLMYTNRVVSGVCACVGVPGVPREWCIMSTRMAAGLWCKQRLWLCGQQWLIMVCSQKAHSTHTHTHTHADTHVNTLTHT